MEDGSTAGSDILLYDGLRGLGISAAFTFVTVIFCCWCYGRLPDVPAHAAADGNMDVPTHTTDRSATDTVVDAATVQGYRSISGPRSIAGSQAPDGQGSESTAAAAAGDGDEQGQQPQYIAWLRCYNSTRRGLFGDAISFGSKMAKRDVRTRILRCECPTAE